ncbi:BRO family protein [uncultured Pseudomonas sp.]|uniref:BRO-N domain-containing protein n=1 Tax=uncultured Pseudomonas sp. TaxID=114707 RepID=UPI0030D76016|tara:strand:+ start:4090 stop:4536 length:447 start_codon:yes stop_codon:yes gene_type:complete
MKFVKQSFMGIELDILTGHPEHDILFIATQVATASGLKDPKSATRDYRRSHNAGRYLKETLVGESPTNLPTDPVGRNIKNNTVMFTEPETYQMLLRGHAPQSEPFRKWVTEVVLPSIRKTGKFDANEAQDEASIKFSGEFAQLHAVAT